MAISSTFIVTLLVFAFGATFLYFIGTVIIQALRLSIIQVKSDVQIKMDKHQNELEHQQIFLESKRLRLQGKTEGQTQEKSEPKKTVITTLELSIDGDTTGLKEALESIEGIKKFAIFDSNLLLDIIGEITPSQLIAEIEKATMVNVKQVHFAKNPEKTVVKDRG